MPAPSVSLPPCKHRLPSSPTWQATSYSIGQTFGPPWRPASTCISPPPPCSYPFTLSRGYPPFLRLPDLEPRALKLRAASLWAHTKERKRERESGRGGNPTPATSGEFQTRGSVFYAVVPFPHSKARGTVTVVPVARKT